MTLSMNLVMVLSSVMLCTYMAAVVSAQSPTAPPTPPCDVSVMDGAASFAQGTSFLYVDFFEEPSGTAQNQWIISYCNRTNKTPKASRSCVAHLPTSTTTFFAARWNSGSGPIDNGTARCLEAFDLLDSASANFAAGGYVNVTYRSSVSGSRLTIAVRCLSGSTQQLAYRTPENTTIATTSGSATAFILLAAFEPFCGGGINGDNNNGGGGGGDGEGWKIAVAVVVTIVVVLGGVVIVLLCYAKHGTSNLARGLRVRLGWQGDKLEE